MRGSGVKSFSAWALPHESERPGILNGRLDLTCAADDQGRTFIRSQSFRAPFHLSKPYWDEHALIVQIVNPTAGVLAGDVLSSRVVVENGARLLLTTPSANRIHAMPSGSASLEQTFTVADGAWLEVMPELFIPQSQCRYRQRTRIEMEKGGELYFVETLAPGRTARGEIFQFSEIAWDFELRQDNTLIARERFTLQPSDESTTSLRHPFPAGYYASCYVITPHLSPEHAVWRAIHDLASDAVWIGVSRLVAGGSTIKLLCSGSIELTRTLRRIRTLLSEVLPPLRSASRKL